MRQGTLDIWLVIGLLAVCDALLCRHLQMRFYHFTPLVVAGAVTGSISLGYRVSGRSVALARAAHWTLLWLFFVNAGTVLIYIAAARGGPAHDATLRAIDTALGFDWTAWYEFLAPHEALRFALWLVYSSLFAQIMISIFWFSATGRDSCNRDLLLHNIISLLITVAIFRLFPALGHQETPRGPDLAILLALRDGGPWSFDLAQLQGLISFPSYHTVLAVLLTYAHRQSLLLPLVAFVNTLMLLGIPTIGQHYLVDMIAGAVVALVAIAVTAAAPLPRRIAPAASG